MVDTAVLIDDLRDQAEAVTFLEGCGQPLALSVVSGGASTVVAMAPAWPTRSSPAFPDAGRNVGTLRQDLTPRKHPARGAASPLPLL